MRIKNIEKVKKAINDFKQCYEYLEFDNHDVNEFNIELPNTQKENQIYSILFDNLVVPLIQDYRLRGFKEEEIIFNFFCINDNDFYIHFYSPEEEMKVSVYENSIIIDVIEL